MRAGALEPMASPQWFELTIIAQDPTVENPSPKKKDKKILTATARIPASVVRAGPRGPRFHVVDYDAVSHALAEPYDFTAGDGGARDAFAKASDRQLLDDRRFHAQNVYAIAARTLALFESALGRRIPWAFGSHQLYLVPHAFEEGNAFYADDDQALLFGSYRAGRRRGIHLPVPRHHRARDDARGPGRPSQALRRPSAAGSGGVS